MNMYIYNTEAGAQLKKNSMEFRFELQLNLKDPDFQAKGVALITELAQVR